MGWIRTDFEFKRHATTLHLPFKEAIMNNRLLWDRVGSAMQEATRDPKDAHMDGLSRILKLIVIRYRPDLAGGSIYFFELDYIRQLVSVSIEDQSLPAIEQHCTPPEMWMDPEREKLDPYRESKG